MKKMLTRFHQAMLIGACLSMVSALGAVMLGVFARLANWDIQGLDAYAGYAIAAALFLALAETLRHGDHIRVTLVLQKLPPATRNVFEYGCLVAAVGLSAYFAWFAGRLVWVSYVTHDISPGSDATPLWIPQTLMALGCVGFCMAFVEALVARLQGKEFFEVAEGEIARVE